MDFSNYTNVNKLQEIETELQSIHPSLHICGIVSCVGEATMVDVTVRVGGNGDIIAKLTDSGWVKCHSYRSTKGYFIVMRKEV